MPDTSAPENRPWKVIRMFGLVAITLFVGAVHGGCVELVHWGQISDQEGTWGINGVEISQQQDDGSWRRLDVSDGKGRWEVFKNKVEGGGRIRLRCKGYETRIFSQSEFMQSHNILMRATGEPGYGREPDWDSLR